MLIELFVALTAVGFSLMTITFVRRENKDIRENIFIPWIATFIFISLSLSVAQVEGVTCDSVTTEEVTYNYTDNTTTEYTNSWECFQHSFEQAESSGLVLLYGGIGIFMLVYSIIITVIRALEESINPLR